MGLWVVLARLGRWRQHGFRESWEKAVHQSAFDLHFFWEGCYQTLWHVLHNAIRCLMCGKSFAIIGYIFWPLPVHLTVIICGQPPWLKSWIFHLEVFCLSAELLIAFALVSQEPAEVLNSGLPCKGLWPGSRRNPKRKIIGCFRCLEGHQPSKGKKNQGVIFFFIPFRFHHKSSVVVARAAPFFWALWASKNQ